MPNEDLAPNELRRLVAALEMSKALVLDLVRGRSVRKQDVAELRQTVTGIHRVLNALDVEKPWDPPLPPPSEVT